MAVFEFDEESTKWTRAIIKRYKKEFGHIDPEDVVVVRDVSSANSRHYAVTSLVPAQFHPLMPFKVLIRTYECNYAQRSNNVKKLIMHHELKHVGEGRVEGSYKTIPHDVEEFAEFLETYGIGWTNRKDLPNILEKKDKG